MQLNCGAFIDTAHNKQSVHSQCYHFCSIKLTGEINEQQELHIKEKCCTDAFGKCQLQYSHPSSTFNLSSAATIKPFYVA